MRLANVASSSGSEASSGDGSTAFVPPTIDVDDLATLAHMEQDLLQPDHQQHFAVKHMAEIVTSWAERH